MAAGSFAALVSALSVVLATASPSITPAPAAPAASASAAPAPAPGSGKVVSVAEGVSVSRALESSAPQWAGKDADEIVAVMPFKGKVVVLAKDKVDELQAKVPAPDQAHVQVVAGGVTAANDPFNDAVPWSPGSSITNNVAGCTQGFSWVLWSTAKVVGSTASHCGTGTWYNNGRPVGFVSKIGSGFLQNDVEFLAPFQGHPFSADVWIRGDNGNPVLRQVQSAGPNPIGGPIAFYGRTSGGGLGTIVSQAFGGVPGVILATNTQGRPGDSGGPVYVTHSNGNVQARGTVAALTYIDDNGNGLYDPFDTVTGLIYTDVTFTSAQLQATLYLRR